MKVVASFYPIYEFAKIVGGNKVDVTRLIPLGVEPHDFDPTIQQIQNQESADIVIYNGLGLEKWVDKINTKFKIDASQDVKLLTVNRYEKSIDPHVWLEPILAEKEIQNIRNAFVKKDPTNSHYYNANADKFIAKLNDLDTKIRTILVNCTKRDFIAFHNAFTYFADRYGLIQHSVLGLTPKGEVLPLRLQEIIRVAKNLGLDTIYWEDLIHYVPGKAVLKKFPMEKS